MTHVLITGANRGLGLEFTKQYLNDGFSVTATCRDPERADALMALAADYPDALTVRPLAVDQAASITALKTALGDRPIDILINNAGVYGSGARNFDECDFSAWNQCLAINAVAPFQIAHALLPNLKAGADKRLVFITSKMGSIADNNSGDSYAYRASKAALNAAGRSLSIDMRSDGICLLLLHPGWVQTDMGGSAAPTTPEQSVTGMRARIAEATLEQTGSFLDFRGQEISW